MPIPQFNGIYCNFRKSKIIYYLWQGIQKLLSTELLEQIYL